VRRVVPKSSRNSKLGKGVRPLHISGPISAER
jgi:hypothetical protein